jgi:hypothetical protein
MRVFILTLLALTLAACEAETDAPAPAPAEPFCTDESVTEVSVYVRLYRDGAEVTCAEAFAAGAPPALLVIGYDGAREAAAWLCDSNMPFQHLGQPGTLSYRYSYAGRYPHDVTLDGRILHTVALDGLACQRGKLTRSIAVELPASAQ